MSNVPTVEIAPFFVASGDDVTVNQVTAGWQQNARATPLSDGRYLVTWNSQPETGPARVSAQLFAADGTPVGSEFGVGSPDDAWQVGPSVAADQNGGFVISWVTHQSGTGDKVWAQIYNAAGAAVGAEIEVATRAPSVATAARAQIAVTADGGFVVTYDAITEYQTGEVYARMYNASGVAAGASFQVNSFTSDTQWDPKIAALDGGGFLVTWQSILQNEGGIYGQRYDAAGTAVGGEFRANTGTPSNEFGGEATKLVGGGFVITWTSYAPNGGGIYAQIYAANGSTVGGPQLLDSGYNGGAGNNAAQAVVTALPDGGFVAGWHAYTNEPNTYGEIFVREYNADGSPRGAAVQANISIPGYVDVREPQSIIVAENGDVMIFWQAGHSVTATLSDIYAQRYSTVAHATEQVSLALEQGITIGDDASSNTVTVTLSVDYGLLNIANAGSGVTATGNGTGSIVLTGTVDQLNALLAGGPSSKLSYFADIDTPPSTATLTVLVRDVENQTSSATTHIGITGTPELATAHADAARTNEVTVNSGNLFADNGSGADTSTGGQALIVSAINGVSGSVGTTITLASGALLTVQSDGSYIYDPNGKFTALGAAGSGASNLSAHDSFTYTLVNGNTAVVTLTITGVDNNDVLLGTPLDDIIGGGAGSDTIDGGDGDDTLYAGTVSPGWIRPWHTNPYTAPLLDTGTDVDTLKGGNGNDKLSVGYGDNADGGSGDDSLLISFLGASAGVTASFHSLSTPQTIGGGTLEGFEHVLWIEGSNFDDTLTGVDDGGDFAPIFGRDGNDHLISGNGTGNLYGGNGNDTLDATASFYSMELYGDAGNDTILGGLSEVHGGTGDDIITGGERVHGDDGNDTITVTDIGASYGYYGDAGDDHIIGWNNNDVLFGGSGADILEGGGGNDSLYAANGGLDNGAERDQLFGGDGNDTLSIGYGDSADGGDGADTLFLTTTGATSGLNIDLTDLVNGANVGGGIIKNIEVLDGIAGTGFDDIIKLGNFTGRVQVTGGGGNDTLTATTSSVYFLGGSGNDVLTGGSAGDALDGGIGNDIIIGGAGDDSVHGGDGDDLIEGGLGDDYLRGDAGIDTASYAHASGGVSAQLSLGLGLATGADGSDYLEDIENLIGSAFADTLNGSYVANVIDGGDGNDVIHGLEGNDTLNGGKGDDTIDGGADIDTMSGGEGNDIYVVDSLGDVAIENANEGNDTIETALSYSLAGLANVENLTLTGTAAVDGTGNALANVLTGNAAANMLIGGGGADTLIGGFGDDYYVVTDSSTVIVELAGEGNDTIRSSVSYVLGAGVSVEMMRLMGTASVDLTGNADFQTLAGNSGNNVLDSGGGGDRMKGVGGDDTYIVRSAADSIVEVAGDGNDTVKAAVSFTLGAAAQVEHLMTLDATATTAIDLTGNAYSHDLQGNAGANVLTGGVGDDILDGGIGADQMQGGTGSDTYIVDNVGDTVFEANSGGVDYDTVMTTVSWALGAGQEVERLRAAPGTNPINLTGNDYAQKMQGNDGDNILTGGGGNDGLIGGGGADVLIGGTGLDKLTGGLGADTFVFEHGGQMDQIVDFAVGTDKADLTAFGLTWQDVQAAMTESNGNTILTLGGGDSVVFAGVSEASLSASDFLLGGNTLSNTLQSDMWDGGSDDMLHAQIQTSHAMFEWHML